jgi:hypothetical protein
VTRRDDRIAFLVHEPTLWAHYASVWAQLPPDAFVIVLTRRFRADDGNTPAAGARAFLERVDAQGYTRLWARDVLYERLRFGHVVTNHKVGGEGLAAAGLAGRMKAGLENLFRAAPREFAPRPYWPMQIGDRQIRFMYGADIGDGWSLAEWNSMYDAFLCHGPNDEKQVSLRFRGRTFQMGYPRYDAYFDEGLDTSREREQFVQDPERRTVLWMPTFGEGACSIPHFATALEPLQRRYNFIVRPHPLSFREAPEDIRLLQSLGFVIDDDALRDMNRLYRIVDAVLCDYGGSAFGSLYLRKRMVLLDVPGSADWYTVRNSSNLELAGSFPRVSVADAGSLPALLEDDAAWDARCGVLADLSAKYFANLRGDSSRQAASILARLREESILPGTEHA